MSGSGTLNVEVHAGHDEYVLRGDLEGCRRPVALLHRVDRVGLCKELAADVRAARDIRELARLRREKTRRGSRRERQTRSDNDQQ